MADEIQEKVLEAIDVLINNRLNQLDSDTTITATIIDVLNDTGTEYNCEGNGNNFNATCFADNSFAIGDSVYVLTSKERNLILGKVNSGQNITETSFTTQNNYYSVGGNFISLNSYTEKIGISSFKKSDIKTIYNYDNEEENNLINISELELAKFTKYIEKADSLILQATFQTNLPIDQIKNTSGVYGLRVVLNFEQKDDNEEPFTWTKTLYLNSSTMIGNPYQYTSPTKQYIILNLKDNEGRYFKNIQSIDFIGGNFVTTDQEEIENNIFCSNITLSCLKEIEKTNDYYILIDTPTGACFNSISNEIEDNVIVNASVYLDKTDISMLCSYAWFVEDSRINIESTNYRSIAGPGWRYLGSENISRTFSSIDNQASEIRYLCVASYNNETIIQQHFSLFNIANNLSKIKVYSLNGKINFSFNSSTPTLICLIDDTENFDNSYNFFWYKKENNFSDLITDELTAQNYYETLRESLNNTDPLALMEAKNNIDNYKGVILNNNRLTYPVKNITTNQITFICQVYKDDIFIGQDSITLSNLIGDNNKHVIINNGNQVFQYTETGESPCLESRPAPQEILPLTAQAFNSIDDPILNSNIQSVVWKFPSVMSSMIIPPSEAELLNEDNNNYYLNATIDQPINFTIKPIYDIFANNNQISVILQTINGETYTGSTNFTFTKIGDFNNNGINLVAKITPINNVKNLTLFLQKSIIDNNNNYYTNKNYIGINVNYDGTTNTSTIPTHSIIEALHLLEEAPNPKTLCGYWAEYIKLVYLTNNISVLEEELQICKTLYYNLNQIFNNQKTVEEVLFNYLDNYQSTLSFDHWSDGNLDNTPRLKVRAYKSGAEITPNKITWSILGSTNRSKFLSVSQADDPSECIVGMRNDLNDIHSNVTNNLLIQAMISYIDEENKESVCYAVYPINIVILSNNQILPNNFEIIEDQTLRSVMYNKEGRNPIYNSKLGVALKGIDDFTYSYWIPESGNGDSSLNAPMTVEQEDFGFYKVIPNNIYNGEFTNTNIHIILYNPINNFNNLTSIYKQYGQPKVDVYIPIHFYLNTHELTALNSWDGNHLTINEEENYILAPQIGAGKKESDNSFTGLVMGEAKYYEDIEESTGELKPSSSIGLLGYNHGKQSIFLDAETGSAVFGLPEQRASAENSYTEGRVVINPGGESKIGMWTIGSRALYNINKGLQIVDKDGNPTQTSSSHQYVAPIGHDPDLLKSCYLSNDEIGLDYTDYQNNREMISYGYAPYFRYFKDRGWTSTNKGAYDIKNASVVIPPDAQGLVLSANPAFISAKTMPLKHTNIANKVNTVENGYLLTDINLGQGGTVLQEGDSLEVQINPNSTSPFGIFRHTRYSLTNYPSNYAGRYYRYPLMGINHNGQLFVNSLQNGETDLRIGQVEAFGYQVGSVAENSPFLGHKFIYTDESNNERVISKMFINKSEDSGSNLSPLYITAGQNQTNEYSRSINIHGKTINLFATKENDQDTLTSHRLIISDDNIELGHLEALTYITNERTVYATGFQIDGWDEYVDSIYPNFKYYGSLFERNISTIYKSNNVIINPGEDYYVNIKTPSDIRALEATGLIPITKNLNVNFTSFGSLNDPLPIIKVCIPVHWNKDGIIDSVYADDYIINSDNIDIDSRECYYYNINGSKVISASIYPSGLIGKHFNSVKTDIIKFIVNPTNINNFTIEQLDLNKIFNLLLDEDDGSEIIESEDQTVTISSDYPENLNEYTLKPSNLNENVLTINNLYTPPNGYVVYEGNNIPSLNNYVGTSNVIFIKEEITNESTEGAILKSGNSENLYWKQTVTASFLARALKNTTNIKSKIPISSYTLNNNVLVSATDVCGNDWTNHLDQIESFSNNEKGAYNYFNIGNNKNGSLTNSTLNLPTNDFSVKVQDKMFEFNAIKNYKTIDFNTNKGMKFNTAADTQINLIGSSGDIKFSNYNNDTKELARISAIKRNSGTLGSFFLGAWEIVDNTNNLIAQIQVDSDKQLYTHSKNNTICRTQGNYYIQTLGDIGKIVLEANLAINNNKYWTLGTNTASLILTPGAESGSFTLKGGKQSVTGDVTGLTIYSNKLTKIQGGTSSWIKIYNHNTLKKDVLETNADFYFGKKNLYNITNINIVGTGAESIKTSGGITVAKAISSGSITSTGTITSQKIVVADTGSESIKTAGSITSVNVTSSGLVKGAKLQATSSDTDSIKTSGGISSGNITSSGLLKGVKLQTTSADADSIKTSGGITVTKTVTSRDVSASGTITASGLIKGDKLQALDDGSESIKTAGGIKAVKTVACKDVAASGTITANGLIKGTKLQATSTDADSIKTSGGIKATGAISSGSISTGAITSNDTITGRSITTSSSAWNAINTSGGVSTKKTIYSEQDIIAYNGVTGKQTSLYSHTHPFSCSGRITCNNPTANTTEYHYVLTFYEYGQRLPGRIDVYTIVAWVTGWFNMATDGSFQTYIELVATKTVGVTGNNTILDSFSINNAYSLSQSKYYSNNGNFILDFDSGSLGAPAHY